MAVNEETHSGQSQTIDVGRVLNHSGMSVSHLFPAGSENIKEEGERLLRAKGPEAGEDLGKAVSSGLMAAEGRVCFP